MIAIWGVVNGAGVGSRAVGAFLKFDVCFKRDGKDTSFQSYYVCAFLRHRDPPITLHVKEFPQDLSPRQTYVVPSRQGAPVLLDLALR